MIDGLVNSARHRLALRRWLRKPSQRSWTEFVRVSREVYG